MHWSLKTKISFVFLLTISICHSQTVNQAYKNYIDSNFKQALIQKNKYGIPASIILAQGLLESGAGKSSLAIISNNHFGIKCAEWKGERVFQDDDAKNECFRKYGSVLESYEDHSQFIRNRARYASLFTLSPIDYEGWAHGLKKAGYATDPTYAYKLISIIENYGLHKYDLVNDLNDNSNISTNENSNEIKPNNASMQHIDAITPHKIFINNKVHYIIAAYNDTYASLADEFNMSEKRLRLFNEVNKNVNLQAGEMIYLQTKKRIAAKNYSIHQVVEGESMFSISQKYAIKIEYLYKMNNMLYTEGAKVGQQLKLRK